MPNTTCLIDKHTPTRRPLTHSTPHCGRFRVAAISLAINTAGGCRPHTYTHTHTPTFQHWHPALGIYTHYSGPMADMLLTGWCSGGFAWLGWTGLLKLLVLVCVTGRLACKVRVQDARGGEGVRFVGSCCCRWVCVIECGAVARHL